MNCSNCSRKNIPTVHYCTYCGHKFTDEEKQKAYQKTFYYKLDKVEKWYNHLTLSTITSSIYYKIGSIIILLVVGIYLLLTIGINTKILDSQDYEIFYNKENQTYYLLTNNQKEEIEINLYKPNRLKELTIEHYNNNDEIIDKKTLNDSIILKTYNEDYYIFNSKYSNDNIDKIRVIIYQEKDLN